MEHMELLRELTKRLQNLKQPNFSEAYRYIERKYKKKNFSSLTNEEMEEFLKVTETGKVVELETKAEKKIDLEWRTRGR